MTRATKAKPAKHEEWVGVPGLYVCDCGAPFATQAAVRSHQREERRRALAALKKAGR